MNDKKQHVYQKKFNAKSIVEATRNCPRVHNNSSSCERAVLDRVGEQEYAVFNPMVFESAQGPRDCRLLFIPLSSMDVPKIPPDSGWEVSAFINGQFTKAQYDALTKPANTDDDVRKKNFTLVVRFVIGCMHT